MGVTSLTVRSIGLSSYALPSAAIQSRHSSTRQAPFSAVHRLVLFPKPVHDHILSRYNAIDLRIGGRDSIFFALSRGVRTLSYRTHMMNEGVLQDSVRLLVC